MLAFTIHVKCKVHFNVIGGADKAQLAANAMPSLLYLLHVKIRYM